MKSQAPAEVLEQLLTRWRAALPVRYPPTYIDGFIRRNWRQLEGLVAGVLARRKAARGDRPVTAEEFAAYDPLVARERPRSAESPKAILTRLMSLIDADLRQGYREQLVLNNLGLEYIDTHAEAIMLRSAGWDAVPLLLPSPALAVLTAGSVVALRDSMGGLAIHPDRRGTLSHLHADLRRAEARILEIREVIRIETNTKEQLAAYAKALWKRARATSTQ